jgi:hypothetical protein
MLLLTMGLVAYLLAHAGGLVASHISLEREGDYWGAIAGVFATVFVAIFALEYVIWVDDGVWFRINVGELMDWLGIADAPWELGIGWTPLDRLTGWYWYTDVHWTLVMLPVAGFVTRALFLRVSNKQDGSV